MALDRKDFISEGAIKAPLEQAENVLKLADAYEKLLKLAKQGDEALGMAKSTREIATESKNLIERQKELDKVNMQVVKSEARLSDQYKSNEKRLVALKAEKQEQTRINKLQEKLNRSLEGSYDRLSAQYSLNKIQLNKMSKEQRQTTESGKKLEAQTKDLYEEMKRLQGATGKNQLNVGTYGSALDGLKGKFQGLLGNVGPLLAGGGLIAGVGLAGKALFDLNKKLESGLRDVRKLLNVTGVDAERYTARITAISDVFEKDFNEVLRATNVLTETFGQSGTEALEIIEQALVRGVDIQDDFLEQISEYSVFFAEAGLEAQTLVDILVASEDKGIFSDKALDAVKEATISIREMTPATRDAINALGLSADRIQADLASGATTMTEVIASISEEMGKLPPQSAKVGTAIADIFRGAGEDAGLEFLLTLQDLGKAQGDWTEELTETQKSQLELLEAQEDLNVAVLEMDVRTGALTNKLKTLWANIQNTGVKILTEIGNLFTTAADRQQDFMNSIANAEDLANLNKILREQKEELQELQEAYDEAKEQGVDLFKDASFSRSFRDVSSRVEETKNRIEELTAAEEKEEEQQKKTTLARRQTNKELRETQKIIADITDAQTIGTVGEGELKITDPSIEKHEKSMQAHAKYLQDRNALQKQKDAELADHLKESSKQQLEIITEEFASQAIELYATVLEARISSLDAELNAFVEQKEKQLEAAEGNKERQQAIRDEIEEREKQHQKEVAALRRKQAIADKALAITQTIVNTARAVVAALAPPPLGLGPVAGIPIAIATGALGAAQLATIIAQPIPQFAKGTKSSPEGYAVVNEEGPELMKRGSKYFMADSEGAARTYLQRGTEVIPADETQRILSQEALGSIGHIPSVGERKDLTGKIITELKELRRAHKKQQTNINLTTDDRWLKIREDYA